MAFAKINKSDNLVTHLASHSYNPEPSDLFYEIEVEDPSVTFTKSVYKHQFIYTAPEFIEQGPRLEGEKKKVADNLGAYVGKLQELGFDVQTQNAYSITEVTNWLGTLDYSDPETIKKLFQSVAFALTSLGYGWNINPDE